MTVLAAITEAQVLIGVVVAAVGLAIQVAVLLERHLRLMGRRFDDARDHTDKSFKEARDHTDQCFKEAREHTDQRFREAREHTDALRDHVDAGLREARDHTDACFKEARDHTDACFKEARDHTDKRFKEAREHTDASFKEARRDINSLRGDVHRIDKGLVRLDTTVRALLLKPSDPLPDSPDDDESGGNPPNLHSV